MNLAPVDLFTNFSQIDGMDFNEFLNHIDYYRDQHSAGTNYHRKHDGKVIAFVGGTNFYVHNMFLSKRIGE